MEQCSSALNVRCPQVPLYQTNVVRAYNSDLQGVKVSALSLIHISAANYMNLLTHDNFFRSDIETLEPVPGVIKEYEILSDKQWKFTIRDDVKFHNGEKLTTADMVASMEYARENPVSYTHLISVRKKLSWVSRFM